MITHTSLEELWTAIFDLTEAHGAAPMSQHKDGWIMRLDRRWCLAVNGLNESLRMRIPPPNSHELLVPPFHVYVDFNGWPFAFITPETAEVGCGEVANIDTLYEAIVQATERRRQES